MRRMNYSRPARVARVTGRRVGAKGRPQMNRERDERKRDLDIERSWTDSGWILKKSIDDVALSFELNTKPKTSQVTLAVGDWLRFVWKDTEEVMVLTKIKTSKTSTIYHVERAIHRTKPTAFGVLTDIYVNR